MKPSSLKKTFGIISYFPDNDSPYHIETRRERTRRCSELLFKLEELWPDIDIIIIAQNWQDYESPKIKNKVIRYDYDKLGIVGARITLREKFLESDYDYLIMLDDDGMIKSDDPSIYMNEIDKHPDGMGVIRHTGCPLMLCAVSKFIYSNVPMPNIRAENDEGFEDDLFVAQCFNKYPDKCFDFPVDCVTEKSFRWLGPGKCPSTWAKEQNHDWQYMCNITHARLRTFNHKQVPCDENKKIDFVVPFVEASDKQWIADYNKRTGSHTISGVRFRSWGTLKYLFRAIAENMPFIGRIILIVARESQVPDWVNRDTVKIIYHRDFIPAEFLPTFNSCTIESFLYRIEDLSDEFIYSNDDIFPTNPMLYSDFFTDGKPHIKFLKYDSYPKTNLYRAQCRNGLDAITNALGLEKYPPNVLITPEHSMTPMLKSTLKTVGKLCERTINFSISLLRQHKNINQYIYAYYDYVTDNYIDDVFGYLYLELRDNLKNIRTTIINDPAIHIICLNDSDKIKNYNRTKCELLSIFNERYPEMCRFER